MQQITIRQTTVTDCLLRKNGWETIKKQTLSINTWKHAQACSWETEKTFRVSYRYSQKLARQQQKI